ncbi:solute carrier family 45 member 3-like [Physella acuta]|uniref:solute carrier family 45 member 3-like n=1 Tax=Physella acuta TaxID=109671 RepID=UPI0027DBC59F|nr:solute carrier family 45 member 3-like [Physella acuta]
MKSRGVFQTFLVAAMLGIESCITMEMIVMIANVQTLGVPVRYSSLSGIVGAVCSLLFIPTVGYFIDKLAVSILFKAKLLIGSVCLQLTGTLVVLTANCLKLFVYADDNKEVSQRNAFITKTTHYPELNSLSYINQSTYSSNLTEREGFGYASRYEPDNEEIHFYAILAMIGYSLNDCGYAPSNCFLRTFALASTPIEEHESVLVKAIFLSSLGGCLVAVLGSVGVGTILTAGTSMDVSAAQTAILSGLCVVLVALGLTTTLTTGFCCKPSRRMSYKEIISVTVCPGDKARSGVCGHLHRQRKQMVVCLSSCLLISSLTSYEIYFSNFIGEGILGGDPQADTSSLQYKNYVRGIELGSSGTLIYYISYTICNVLQEFLLRKIGWKMEMLIASLGNIVVNIVCALTAEVWCVYMMAVWSGFFKTVVYTVPYILACQIAVEQTPDKSTGAAISGVASMLPTGYMICLGIVAPLIDVTGNSATSIYYTIVTSLLGLVAMGLLQLVR